MHLVILENMMRPQSTHFNEAIESSLEVGIKRHKLPYSRRGQGREQKSHPRRLAERLDEEVHLLEALQNAHHGVGTQVVVQQQLLI